MLTKQHAALEKTHGALVQQEQKSLQVLAVLQERYEQAQNAIVEHNLAFTNKMHQLTTLGKEMAVLKDQHNNLEQTLNKAHDKIENLRNERQFLIQEKHELQGCLRQLESVRAKKEVVF